MPKKRIHNRLRLHLDDCFSSRYNSEIILQNRRNFERKKPLQYLLFPSFRSKGFTLIELLVVMAIIGILATLVLANYNNFGARQEVKNAAEELKSNLRKYQTYALASQKNPTQSSIATDCYNPADTAEHPMAFYNVVVTKTATTTSYGVSLVCDSVINSVVITNSFPWSGSASVAQVGYYDDAHNIFTAQDSVGIEFKPLSQEVNLESPDGISVPPGSSIYIRLTNTGGSATYNVFVSRSGEIREESQ